MKRLAICIVIVAGFVGAQSSQASAMSWAYKFVEDPAGPTADSTSECSFAYGTSGYLNASRFLSGTACVSNATSSAWDSDLRNDTFLTTDSGLTPSLSSTGAWRNQYGASYIVYQGLKCTGATIGLPAFSGTVLSPNLDLSVARPAYVLNCQLA